MLVSFQERIYKHLPKSCHPRPGCNRRRCIRADDSPPLVQRRSPSLDTDANIEECVSQPVGESPEGFA